MNTTDTLATDALATDALATDALATDALATDALATDALATDALATDALRKANMQQRVTLDALITDCPELRKLTVGQLQQYSSKEIASRFLLRAFTSRALSGSAVDWQDKSIKGAMLSTASKCRAVALEPKANEWKGLDRSSIIDRVNEMLIAVHSAVAPATKATATAATELEKARKYISGLSPETLAALRKEGVI